jgi:hypothetical protein
VANPARTLRGAGGFIFYGSRAAMAYLSVGFANNRAQARRFYVLSATKLPVRSNGVHTSLSNNCLPLVLQSLGQITRADRKAHAMIGLHRQSDQAHSTELSG